MTFVSSPIVASRNQGNSLNETNRSLSAMSSQNPWGETLVTSTSEVLFPRCPDFILMPPYDSQRRVNTSAAQSMILRQLQLRLQPELRLAGGMLHVHEVPVALHVRRNRTGNHELAE